MSLNTVSFFNFTAASRSRDWTQRELAEFYRVEASLVRANIQVETDRGRSDEGDPWFVFCNARTGEIIVHFARFDGTYVVASPALDGCARGHDFRALIEAQIASHPLVMPKSASGGKLFIHPAALLIVLVAAWFFKLSKTTAASELHETHPARSGVGSLGHSDSESHAVLLDERASATLLAAVAMGAAWAQSHDFSLWSMGAALPTIPHVSSQDIGETNILSNVASSLFAEGEGFFHAQNGSGAYDFRPANTSEGPSAISAGYRLLSVSNDHFAAYQTFHNFDMPTLAEDQTARATCEQPSSATPLSAPAPIGGSTVSSESTDAAINPETPNAAVNSDTTDPDTTPTVQGSTLSTPVSGTENALTADATPTGSIPIVGATTTYALTTGNNTNKSLGHDSAFAVGDVIIGVIDTASGRANTLNPGDALLLSGATLRIIDIQHSKTTNELSDLSLAGPFQFIVHELAAEGGVFDFTLASGATRVESLNSTGNVTFTNLAKGTISEISGSTTHAGSIVSVTYALPTTAESFEINGGVSGVSFETPATSTDAPTTETILSTGAANGTAAKPDLFHITNSAGSVTSLTMVASASLVAGLWDLDFNDAAGATTLTVSGPAALVDLTQDFTDAPFSTVSASGLTAGGLHLCASNDLTSFTGGGGGNNELLYTGEDLSASATKIDGGGTGNILSSQLVNLTNGGIFANWQILDITDYGGTPFDTSWLSNDPITGAQFHAGDRSAETVLNIAPAATAAITGTGFTVSGLSITHSSAVGDSLAITIDNTDSSAALSTLWLSKLTSTGDTTVAVDSTGAAGNMAAGWNGIGTLDETDGHLTTMTVTGNTYTYVGSSGGISTDSGATSTADITSALTKIDASATTGGASIYAGNTTLDGSGFEVNYTGLTIDGGSGTKDVLYNGANDGVTVDLNGNGDAIWLGGSKASGVLGTGASDMAVIGSSPYSTALIANGPEWAGAALGDTVKFGAGATAEVIISGGAEWDGAHYVGNNIGNGVGQTTVVGAVVAGAGDAGTLIDVDYVVGAVTNIQNEQAAITGAMNLTAAENAAVAALGAVGVAYFTYGSDKFLVAAHTAEAAVSAGDAVVELHGVSITGLYMVGGVVHLV
jgi:hypothetical protein